MKTIRVAFDSLAAGGDAVGRDEQNRVVFAPRIAPGEIAEIAIEKESKTFAHGRLLRVLEASSQRVAAPCPYFRDDVKISCGGCAWQQISYTAQLEAKRQIVRDALQRIGGVDEAEKLVAPCLPSPREFAYRNKADFVIANDEKVRPDSHVFLGFFAPDSHRVVDLENCLIQQEPNNAILAAVREAMKRGLVSPFDAQSGRGVLRRLVARTSSIGESLACAVSSRADWPQERAFAEFLMAEVPSLAGVLRRELKGEARVLAGRDWLEESVDGLRFRVRGEGFFQVNTWMVQTLVESALRLADVREGERMLDLFCGVGLFSLAMAKRGARVLGIERSPAAVRDAKENAALNQLQADFLAGDAATHLKQLAKRGETFDCLLLDPPRAGAAECLPAIMQLAPRRIVYVSCDPASLARDLKMLQSNYRLRAAVPLDLFPQTAHVETVVLLEKIVASEPRVR